MDSRQSGRLRDGAGGPRLRAGAARAPDLNSEARRGTPRNNSTIAGGASPPQRRVEGDRQGESRRRTRPAPSALMDEVASLKATIQDGEAAEKRLDQELLDLLAAIPNIPAADVPVGPDDSANVESAQGRHASRVRLSAEAAFRARRGSRPHGFRDRGETVGLALRCAQGTLGAARTRAGAIHARPAHRTTTAIPRSIRRCWCATTPCSAPRSCRSSGTTSSPRERTAEDANRVSNALLSAWSSLLATDQGRAERGLMDALTEASAGRDPSVRQGIQCGVGQRPASGSSPPPRCR